MLKDGMLLPSKQLQKGITYAMVASTHSRARLPRLQHANWIDAGRCSQLVGKRHLQPKRVEQGQPVGGDEQGTEDQPHLRANHLTPFTCSGVAADG